MAFEVNWINEAINKEDKILSGSVKELDQIDIRLIDTCRAYLMKNDIGHQWSHVIDVARLGLRLADTYSLDHRPFLLAAVCHDIFSSADRANHHQLSYEWVLKNLSEFGYEYESALVATMCLQHRASFRDKYLGIYQECFAAADRGVPSFVGMIKRSYFYARGKDGKSHEEAVVHACNHIRDKYGSKGYGRWPDVSIKMFGDLIKTIGDMADRATADDISYILRRVE